MTKTNNDQKKQGTKGLETKDTKVTEKIKETNMTETKKEEKKVEKKAVKKAIPKVDKKKEELKTLYDETSDEILALAKGIIACPTKTYTGYKFFGKLIASLRPKKDFFIISVHNYNTVGKLATTEGFDIKNSGKEVDAKIKGILGQILKSYENIKTVKKPQTKKAKDVKKGLKKKNG